MTKRPTHIPALADLVATAWKDHSPDAQFTGLTLEQFRAKTDPSANTRNQLVSLTAQHRAKRDEREAADNISVDTVQRVVGAVRSDPVHGPDSPLLAAMGYVTRSARKSGKTNKKNGQVNGNTVTAK